ncbi:MAG: hypothetical protein RR100_05245, partial [Comamonas sp.]
CKVGFGLDNDKTTLPRRLGCELQNVVDLDRVFKQYGYGNSTGVRAAVALVLGQNFHKSKKMSTSNWAARQYSPGQLRYAANDAHGPAVIYAALPAWQARQPAPAAARPPRQPRPPRAPEPQQQAAPQAPQHGQTVAAAPMPSRSQAAPAASGPSTTPSSAPAAAPATPSSSDGTARRRGIAALFQPRRG